MDECYIGNKDKNNDDKNFLYLMEKKKKIEVEIVDINFL